ncbi:MAG: J domain-containing protein [Clostridia bacterium]|nr:J domain-containing protein [Clostridia bacterium]
MLELKNAHEILGVKEGASKDEIIKRYDILLKKYRMTKTGDGEDISPKVSIDDINKAYNLLMGYGNEEPEEDSTRNNNSISSKLFKKAGIDEKKARNFLYYYKFHVLGAIIGLILIGSVISSFVNKVEPDLNLVVAGEFHVSQTDALQNDIKNSMPQLKAISIDPLYLTKEPQNQMDYGMRTKFVTIMAAGEIDVLVLDEDNFKQFGEKGAFVSLDSLAGELGINKDDQKKYILKDEESGQEHLFGINVTKSSLLKSVEPQEKEKIAVIRVNCKNYDNAVKLMKLLIK